MSQANLKLKIIKIIAIFILAFLFNLIWEFFHARFYVHYQGNVITTLILIKAALFDAALITLLYVVFLPLTLKKRLILITGITLVFAVGLERYALATKRWSYNSLMPVLPLIDSGLTPTIQLALLSLLVIFIIEKFYAKAD